MATLNGWQRLWVVFTVFWTVGGLSISYATWPSPSDYLRTLREAPQTIEEARARGLKVTVFLGRSSSTPTRVPDDPDGGFVARAPLRRQALRDDRVEHVQTTLMVWAIPPVVLYAFGWSAGWIRRGFRG